MKKLLFTILLFLISSYHGQAQIKIDDKNAIEKIKNGNTYVIVRDLNFPQANDFLRIFKKYWTISKSVEFIKINDLEGKLKAGDTYFNLEVLMERRTYGNMQINSVFVFLKLWYCYEGYLKEDRQFKQSDQKELGRVELSGDDEVTFKAVSFFENYDFDGGGHIFNWSPGILKNYLQQLSILLQANKKTDLYSEITDKSQLKLLQDSTLYSSEDNLKKFSPFPGKRGTSSDVEDIFGKYQFKYENISNEDLNQKLLRGEKFYYLLFVRSSSSKIIAVVNSETGETIYSRVKGLAAYNLKPDDLKTLSKQIL